MNNTQLAELLLTTIYDESEKRGHGTDIDLMEVSKKFGVTDLGKVNNIATYLESHGLIEPSIGYGGTTAIITGKGAIFVENGGDTGIIKQYRANPSFFVINDNSIKISGNVSNSNFVAHSSHVSQTISINPEVDKLLTQIIEILKQDSRISQEELADALQDIEALKIQLLKTNKNETTIKSILGTLKDITSITALIAQLWQLLNLGMIS